MSGTLTYLVPDGADRFKMLRLTVCADEDGEARGLAVQRRKRLSRILSEASGQGAKLSYRDLSIIMLASKSTLKRDLKYLRRHGLDAPMGQRVS
jgi:hypothetical protein